MTRYAVYFAPAPEHPLWRAGCDWLGRDARSGLPPATQAPPQRAGPWRYGFHATLKAPCRLAVDKREFLQAVRALAARHRAFELPRLQVAPLSDFVALLPAQPLERAHPLWRLADACVVELDALRAAPSAAERERSLRGPLSARQRDHAQRHGYAHVLDDWRFHLTVSDGGLEADAMAGLRASAEAHFAGALRVPLAFDALCVFVEPEPGAPFTLAHRFALEG
jgi:hypothetical protein